MHNKHKNVLQLLTTGPSLDTTTATKNNFIFYNKNKGNISNAHVSMQILNAFYLHTKTILKKCTQQQAPTNNYFNC